jgi:hypothetical protein
MKRFTVLLLLGLGTLTAGRARAGQLDAPTAPVSVDVFLEEVGEPVKPGGAVTPGDAEVSEPLVNITDVPDDTSGAVDEEWRDFVDMSSPPPEVMQTTSGPGEDGTILMSQAGAADVHNTPEPSTLLLASLGAALVGARAYRRRRQESPQG